MDTKHEIGKLQGTVGMLQLAITGGAVVLVAIVVGAFTIHGQLSDIKTDVAVTKQIVSDIQTRVKGLEEASRHALDAQSSVRSSLARIENRLPVLQAMASQTLRIISLKPEDASFVVKTLGSLIANWPEPVKGMVKVGEMIKAPMVKAVPLEVFEKLPELKGYEFTVDERSNVILLSADSRVAGVVPAN